LIPICIGGFWIQNPVTDVIVYGDLISIIALAWDWCQALFFGIKAGYYTAKCFVIILLIRLVWKQCLKLLEPMIFRKSLLYALKKTIEIDNRVIK
jgi:hypothetical protein